jgi:hypothetical protein
MPPATMQAEYRFVWCRSGGMLGISAESVIRRGTLTSTRRSPHVSDDAHIATVITPGVVHD